jgi:hypothetical protein
VLGSSATKRRPDGEKLKLRARLVANGQCQKHGIDYAEMFAPTTNMTTIHAVMSIAAHRDWEIHQICKGITQTLIPDTSAVKPKASQSTDGNLLWSVVYISDTVSLRRRGRWHSTSFSQSTPIKAALASHATGVP